MNSIDIEPHAVIERFNSLDFTNQRLIDDLIQIDMGTVAWIGNEPRSTTIEDLKGYLLGNRWTYLIKDLTEEFGIEAWSIFYDPYLTPTEACGLNIRFPNASNFYEMTTAKKVMPFDTGPKSTLKLDLMADARRQILTEVFAEEPDCVIITHIQPDNIRAQKLAERTGFKLIGTRVYYEDTDEDAIKPKIFDVYNAVEHDNIFALTAEDFTTLKNQASI